MPPGADWRHLPGPQHRHRAALRRRHPRVLLGLRFFSHKVGSFRGAALVGINGNDDAFWPVMVLTGLAVVAINWGVRAPTRAATA